MHWHHWGCSTINQQNIKQQTKATDHSKCISCWRDFHATTYINDNIHKYMPLVTQTVFIFGIGLVWQWSSFLPLHICRNSYILIVQFPKNIHTSPTEILRGRGVAKANLFKEKYGAKEEFLEGWGCKPENLPGGSLEIFWNHSFFRSTCTVVVLDVQTVMFWYAWIGFFVQLWLVKIYKICFYYKQKHWVCW